MSGWERLTQLGLQGGVMSEWERLTQLGLHFGLIL